MLMLSIQLYVFTLQLKQSWFVATGVSITRYLDLENRFRNDLPKCSSQRKLERGIIMLMYICQVNVEFDARIFILRQWQHPSPPSVYLNLEPVDTW